MTKAQEKELIVWEYFIPKNCQWQTKNHADIKKFFEWSERGKHKQEAAINTFLPEGRTYFHALVWGKKYAGINIHELWEKDLCNGEFFIGYRELVKGMPREVVDFIKKEIF